MFDHGVTRAGPGGTLLPFLLCCVIGCLAANPGDTYALTPSQVFDRVASSVVIVDVRDGTGGQVGLGSGVIVDPSVVITNCHVADKGVSLSVRQGSQSVPAYVTAADRDRDICVLRLVAFATIGDPIPHVVSVKNVRVGQEVVAIGAPSGLELSLSRGVISQVRQVSASRTLIQTDAAISPGSSGGGLFDEEGQLLGFTTLFLKEAQNLNFVVPVDVAFGLYPPLRARALTFAPSAAPGEDDIEVEISRLRKLQDEKRRVDRAAAEFERRRAEADLALANRERQLREQIEQREKAAREQQKSLAEQASTLAQQRRELARQQAALEQERDRLAVQRRQAESVPAQTEPAARSPMADGGSVASNRSRSAAVGVSAEEASAGAQSDAAGAPRETAPNSESESSVDDLDLQPAGTRRLDPNAEIRELVADAQRADEKARQVALAESRKTLEAAMIQGYVARIRDRIRSGLVIPPNVAHDASVEFDVTLLFNGTAVFVQMTKSSGNPWFDRAVEQAIDRAQPFVVPSDRDLFSVLRQLKLIFRPSD